MYKYAVVIRPCEKSRAMGIAPKLGTEDMTLINIYNLRSEAEEARLERFVYLLREYKCEPVWNAYYPYELHVEYDNGKIEQISIERIKDGD